MTYHVAQPSWQALRGSTAGSVLASCRYLQPPVDPFGIAQLLGVKTRGFRNADYDGALRFEGDQPTIWVNADQLVVRQRFTCAHELGHLILGHGPQNRDRLSSRGINPLEVAANNFAAELLMPDNWVRTLVHVSSDVERLADTFGVSIHAMQIRMQYLGYRV